MAENGNGRKEIIGKLFMWACAVLVSINLYCIRDVYNLLYDVKLDVERIKANRFTNGDGQNIYRAIVDLEKRIAALPKEIPPPWFKALVYENRDRLKELEQKR